MNRILLIEDDEYKCKSILCNLEEHFPSVPVDVERSYHSGLKAIFTAIHDIIILDMTLPTYDISADEMGGPFRAFAGIEILNEMKRRKLSPHVVVVTQFDAFGSGKDIITLVELNMRLEAFAPTYLGTVFYNPATSKWREELISLVKEGDNRD